MTDLFLMDVIQETSKVIAYGVGVGFSLSTIFSFMSYGIGKAISLIRQ